MGEPRNGQIIDQHRKAERLLRIYMVCQPEDTYCVPAQKERPRLIVQWGRIHAIRVISSSCISLAYIALGRADLLVDWDDKPWDLAAGTLLVEEAGGRVSDLRGGPFRAYEPRCLASHGVNHDEFVDRIVASGAFEFLNSNG